MLSTEADPSSELSEIKESSHTCMSVLRLDTLNMILHLHSVPPGIVILHMTMSAKLTRTCIYLSFKTRNFKAHFRPFSTVTHYTTLHYITQYYTFTRHYTTLHNITRHYTTLHYIPQHYTTLHNITQCTCTPDKSRSSHCTEYLHQSYGLLLIT